ncbi:unnamed protein product, partial [Nesidiocoris tenuis]
MSDSELHLRDKPGGVVFSSHHSRRKDTDLIHRSLGSRIGETAKYETQTEDSFLLDSKVLVCSARTGHWWPFSLQIHE